MIWVKCVASAFVMAATVGLGRLAVTPYQLRVRTLEEWQRLLSHLDPLIEWRRMPLPQALLQASSGQRLLHPAVFNLTRMLERRDEPFDQSWQTMLDELPGLWEEDRRVLADLGRVLGRSDVRYQHDHLQASQRELERLMADAREGRAKDGRLLGALFSALGVMVIILLL